MLRPIACAFSIVFAALTITAAAADEFAVYQTPASPWAGFYVGGNAGLVVGGDSDWTSAGIAITPGLDQGQTFGGQAGYLFQWGALVAGAEVSYSGANNLQGSTSCPYAVFTCKNEIDNLLLLNGRIGYAFGQSFVYGTGGYARADMGLVATRPDMPERITQGDGTLTGWNIGVGFEYMFSDAIIFGVEYLHADLADGSVAFVEADDNDTRFMDVNASLDLIRLRLGVSIDSLTRWK